MSKVLDFRNGKTVAVASRADLRRKRRERAGAEAAEWAARFKQEEVTAIIHALDEARIRVRLGSLEAARDFANEAFHELHRMCSRRSYRASARKGAATRKDKKEAAAMFAKLSGPLPEGGAS
jgi:hypothetical protein